jgi:hypothetical protein
MNAQRSLFHDQAPTVDEIMSAWQHDRNFRSRLEIAEKLGRAKSPALIATINVLVSIGYLTVREIDLPNKVTMYQYSPSEKWLAEGLPF